MYFPGSSHSANPLTDLIAQEVLRTGLGRVLSTVRRHLKMDVAFIARFRETDRIFEYVDAGGAAPIHLGQTLSLAEGYCLKVVNGELPNCIPDTSAIPAAMEIPDTGVLPIGSHLSVPIRLEGGTVYGTLCCFSHASDPTLGERELALIWAFADVIGARVDEAVAADAINRQDIREVREALEPGALHMVFQPVYDLGTRQMKGVESLARFDLLPVRSPDVWFALADRVGLGPELELRAITQALTALDHLPPPLFLGINISPATVYSARLQEELETLDLTRIVLEITEHVTVTDYKELAIALAPMRARGLRVAVDDTGAGFASMRHILNIDPSMIKLDKSLTHDIDIDDRRRALAKGLIAFAHEIGCSISAEGVETASELAMLKALGVDMAQGFYLDRPLPLAGVLNRLSRAPVDTRPVQ